MKKFIMMAALMVVAVSANAQFEPGTFSIQPKLGANISWLSNTPNMPLGEFDNKYIELDKSPIAGALVGVEAEYQFADKFSVAAGLNYTSQGCAWDDLKYPDGTKINEIEAELGYIKIPMVANFYIFKGFAVKAGVQFGFLVNSKLNMHAEGKTDFGDGTNRDTDIYTSINVKDNFKKFDFAIPVGVSYQFNFPIVIDARYQLGLTKLNKASASGINDNKNSVFMVTVGYKFKL